MARILVRSGKDPRTVVSPEASLARNGWGVFGANVGNLLFTSAVHRAVSVPANEVVSNSLLTELAGADDAYIQRINDEFDMFVIPLANAFRMSFLTSLKRLTRVISKLTIPVAVIGVGAQFSPTEGISDVPREVRDATVAFAKEVLDRSASIGVRGEVTRSLLRALGIPDDSIDVIGCPSLFMDGGELAVRKSNAELTSDSPIAMNVTPSVQQMAPLIQRSVEAYPNLTYVPQEHYELAMMLWGEERPSDVDRRIPVHIDHDLYQQNRMRFFLDASTWVDFMRERRFAFGARIHGNIAALMAGTPAVVLAHDSRTLELAEYHDIPRRLIADIGDDVTVRSLYEEADFSAFNAGHRRKFEAYKAFLARNRVENIFGHSDEHNLPFDREMASITFPAPVETLCSKDPDALRVQEKLRWLRQGAAVDKTRRFEGYAPPFAPAGRKANLKADAAALKRSDRRIGELSKRMDALSDELLKARKRAASAERRVTELERVVDRARSAFPMRAVRWARSVGQGKNVGR